MPARVTRAERNNAACRKLDSRWTRMPADRETPLAKRWDHLDGPRTSGSRFRERCAANLECLWPAAGSAISVAALGKETLEKPCLLYSTDPAGLRKKAVHLIPPR